ncbi:MAG TPA: glycosyltransferase family 4 protein [Leptolyngbyaceae cyanobacterium M65_K2018_010]|nr:glycosyltransferase family 4 protein [Leptolyngbyaceae cyanobacterium M65_K2018_010]
MPTDLLVNLAYCLPQPTGTTTYALNLLPYLTALQPCYLSPYPLADLPSHLQQPVPHDMTAARGLQGHLKRLWWTQTQLPQLFRQSQASLLFSPLPEAPLGQGIPYVVTVHDLIPLRCFRPWAPLRLYCRYYLPQILAQARHIICNSTATANDLMRFFQVPAQRLSAIPLAHDTNRFRWLNLEPQNYFLCLGRCAPYKNWGRVVAAFAQLPRHRNYELWLVGPYDARHTPRLQAQAQALGVGHRVRVLNYLSEGELVQALNRALALVFPSLWEGFGLPILEAMACGTAVITSNLASMPEVAGEAALLVDPYRVEAIAQAMERIGSEPGLRSQLQRAGFERAKHFSPQRTGEATVAVLSQAMAQGS